MDLLFPQLNFNSVENLLGIEARVAFSTSSSAVFREDVAIIPTIVSENLSYILWGGDNMMPFDIMKFIEKDATLSTWQLFNAEVCYSSGVQYCL